MTHHYISCRGSWDKGTKFVPINKTLLIKSFYCHFVMFATVSLCSCLSQTIRDTWQILGGCQGWFLTVPGSSGTTGTHGRPLEGIGVGSCLSSDHQEHMADPWKVSGLVPGCTQTIRRNRNTWQILGGCQGWFLAVLRPSGTHGRSLEGIRVGYWLSSDHQGHMADHWRVSGLVPGSPQIIRDTWQTIGGYQGWFLNISDHQGRMG